MEDGIVKNKLEKLKRLNSSFLEKKELHNKKMMRARKFDTEEFHSVSYTHLRAHETGRNLVCRLLLEKKNNPLKTTKR